MATSQKQNIRQILELNHMTLRIQDKIAYKRMDLSTLPFRRIRSHHQEINIYTTLFKANLIPAQMKLFSFFFVALVLLQLISSTNGSPINSAALVTAESESVETAVQDVSEDTHGLAKRQLGNKLVFLVTKAVDNGGLSILGPAPAGVLSRPPSKISPHIPTV